MKRTSRWTLLAFALTLTAGVFQIGSERPARAQEFCSFCGVADPYGQPCFYYGQPCGGSGDCYCGFCGADVACLQM